MSFSSINIQGNIISSETLDKIRSEEKFKYQTPEAFGLARTASLRDEIGLSWSILRTQWQAFKKRLETLPRGDTGTSLTRERFVIPLLQELGYEVNIQKAQQIGGKSYAISHGASNLENFPLHIMGYNDKMDKRREAGGPRLSPHALVQEYLNNTEYLFALTSNGKQLRLLRDATRLVRMSYLEFDLERMFEEELYADFSIMYRVLHSSRMPSKIEDSTDSVIEYYHQESLASGTRIRERLSDAVEESIKRLANGFLVHSYNNLLVEQLDENRLSSKDYYTYQLRLIYRILFIVVLEERKLIFPEELTQEVQRLRSIYYQYYSIERLRKLTVNSVFIDADKYDLWESLKTTFMLFEREEYGAKLGIKPLGSGLFAPQALGNLKELKLNNSVLLDVLKRLTSFINEQGQLVRVNYSDLDVEEFGSIYEGLLEYDPKIEKVGAQYQFSFVSGQDRSSSGSHYTPEELVKPLIKHSLDYIIQDKLKEPNPETALLSIRVCDVACGSGHILLSAARRIATELASLRERAEQPSPTYFRTALRDVIRNCIYGVDLNPLAVELCKVAMWLEAHNPNEPLNFLDHHIKCGNAIVGLVHYVELENGIPNEAFKTLPNDEKEVASAFKKKNTQERKTSMQMHTFDLAKVDDELKDVQKEFNRFINLPEKSPEQIAHKEKAYQDLTKSKKWFRLKNLANLQVAQFFIPKTTDNKNKLTTHSQYITYLKQGTQILDRGTSMAIAAQKHFFHWFLEFPEVFQKGGFDCILGNPPYLGGTKISEKYGEYFFNTIKYYYQGVTGRTDLVVNFLRRNSSIINNEGFTSIVTTNTISQSETRKAGLELLIKEGFNINFAIPLIKWPGEATLEVSLISITKRKLSKIILRNSIVSRISGFLKEEETEIEPFKLLKSKNIYTSEGSKIYGDGFIVDLSECLKIIGTDTKYSLVLKDYLSGDDLNSTYQIKPTRHVIDLTGLTENEVIRTYPLVFSIIKERVKPYRITIKDKKAKNQYWLYQRDRKELYNKIAEYQRVIVTAKTTKYINFSLISPKNIVFSNSVVVIANDKLSLLGILQSSLHYYWIQKYSSTLESRLRYSPSNVLVNFPMPTNSIAEYSIQNFLKLRNEIMLSEEIGLTKLFNIVNDKAVNSDTIVSLRNKFKTLDEAVLEAYGWNQFDPKWGKGIELRHDFYEVDYLPENDRERYTIHPEACKEVLKRLLLLNHELYEEEIKQGHHTKKDVEDFYQQKDNPVPEGIEFIDKKPKKKVVSGKAKKKEEHENKNEYDLFNQDNSIMKEFGLQEGIYTTRDVASIVNKPISRVRSWFNKLVEIGYEGMDKSSKEDVDNKKISFHGLIELVVIGELLDNNFSIRKIFKAREDLANKTNKIFPFATNNINQKMKVSGSDITWNFEDGNITLNGKGQYNLEIVREFFRDIEFKNDIAQRIIPSKGNKRIEINPSVAGGKPALLYGEGIQVEQIYRMYNGAESISDIISDYDGITKQDIEAVLQYKS